MMNQPVEVYQPMPDNLIRVHAGEDVKELEVLAEYKDGAYFSVRLTVPEANWVASELRSPNGLRNWRRLENGHVLRVARSGEVRQLILSDVRGGREISAAPIGVILEEAVDKVVDALRGGEN